MSMWTTAIEDDSLLDGHGATQMATRWWQQILTNPPGMDGFVAVSEQSGV